MARALEDGCERCPGLMGGGSMVAPDTMQDGSPDRSAPAWWDRASFLSDEAQDRRCPEVIDVTGRARFLFFGPFIPLSRGLWRATVHLELCPDAARRTLALQFGVEPDYTTQDVLLDASGSLSPQLDFLCETPGAAQVRLWLKKPAFHGEVRLAGVRVEPIA
jgi:hypothetical protein